MSKEQYPYTFTPSTDGASQKPVLYINKQIIKFPGQIIRVFDSHMRLIAKVHGVPFKLKEKLNIYSDEARKNLIASSEAVKIMDFNAAFILRAAHKREVLGGLRRKGFISEIGQDTWLIYDADGNELAELKEPNLRYSLVRKWLLPFLPQTYHMRLVNGHDGELIIKQTWTPVILRYRIYSDDFATFTKRVPQKLLVSALCTIAVIEGRE